MAELQITCLGRFQVVLAGTALTAFQTDKTRALLLYLVLEGRVYQRTELAQFLWPGYGAESARNSLRQALHQLRQLLPDAEGAPWFLLTRQTVQINPAAPTQVDVLTFQQLLAACAAHAHTTLTSCPPCLARLCQAVDLYQGDFLAGFTVADSDEFEEWRRIIQEQLHIQMLDALSRLANAAESTGDTEGALQAAQRQLTLEPWLEAAHRQIMRLLAQRGQRVAALAQYQRCRQVLAEELSVEPDEETTALYEQIRSGEFDKVTRRQDDRVTSTSSVTLSPSHPVTLSPCHPVTPSPIPLAHNLPPSPSPLVGRAQDLAEIGALLQRPETRLVTLMGPGGMGKTRLAVEVGQRILDLRLPMVPPQALDSESAMPADNPKSKIQSLSWQEPKFPDGVWFVPLAAINSADALPGAIAGALGIALQGGDALSALRQALRQQQLLLILDNFEQLLTASDGDRLGAVDLVVDLLAAAPEVQILITSRERLKLRDEQLYAVPALTFAPNATLAEAAASSAVRLFVQAMQRVRGDFQLTATNLAVVLRICQLVQGMPLGLELAAANAGHAPLTAIADALAQSAEFLAVEWRDLPARQRSMRAVFAWSWRLLSAAEQRVLRQCAVFRGGFDYAAAQAVLGATLPLLIRLVDKSLLQWQAAASGEGRYHLHELLRQFADEALQAAGEASTVAEQQGRYYLDYLAKRGFRLGRHEPKAASAEIQVELDNIRQAWHWAASQGRLTELDQATYAWWQFCQFQGLETEGRQSFAVAIAGVRRQVTIQVTITATDTASALFGQRLLAKLLALHADTLFVQGRDDEMATQAREAISLGATSGGVEGEIYGTFVLGRVAQELDQYQAAGDLWRQTLHLIRTYQPTHPDSELLYELNWMAYVWLRGDALHFGDTVGGRTYMLQALQLAQALGKRRCELHSLSALARTDFYQGDFAAAEPGFVAALDLARKLGYRPVEMGAQGGLGELARLHGDYGTARRRLNEAVRLAAELVLPYDESLILAALIRLHCQLGDQTAAAQRLEQLTQILASINLAKECHLYNYLAAAVKAHEAGDRQAALRFAEQADQVNKNGGDILFRLVDTALILGHVRAAVDQWAEATSAFQEALAAFQQWDKPALAAEAQAGLAQIALAQGDLTGAWTQIEALLPALAQEPHAGYNNPFSIYLTAYRVLAATSDARAASLLQQGYDLLQQNAAKLDAESRQRFLTAVPLHRELAAAYEEMQRRNDKAGLRQAQPAVTERVPSGREVTESPSHGVPPGPTLSPRSAELTSKPHPVTLSPLLDWAEMPVVDFFVERRAEVAQLREWLTPTAARGVSTQLISILGMGGMGKTTLAAAVTKAAAPEFAVVIWRSLLNAPPLSELLRNWLQVLSRQTLTTPPESLDEQLRLLLSYLQQARCLLVLDNVESLFVADTAAPAGSAPPQSRVGEIGGPLGASRAGVTRSGYEGYDQLFQRLAGSEHQSCLLLTSREQPYALLRSGRQAQTTGRVQVLPLAGLDPTAGQVLLASNGLHASAAEAAQLVENYSGNPLALQIVASTIADFFGGDVAAFQQEEGQIFDGMRLVLDQQFARLSPLEREILIWLAIEREPVTVPTLRSNFVQPVASAPMLEALQALQNRSLLEKRDSGLTLQNVIIEYTTEYLVEQVCQEIVDGGWWMVDSSSPSTIHHPPSTFNISFLNRFALLKAQAREEVRQSQVRLIMQPLANRLLAQLGKAQVEERVAAWVEWLQANAPVTPGAVTPGAVTPGYAGGNLLNLLVHMGSDLRGRDFAHIALWQVFLAGVYAPGLNLSGADLTGAVFTQRFDPRNSFHFDTQGDLLLAEVSNQRLRLLRLHDGRLEQEVALPALRILQIHLSPGCKAVLMQLAEDQLALLNLTTGQLFAPLTRHQHSIWRVCFSPDGRLVASGDSSGLVCIWERQSGQLVQARQITTDAVSALAMAPDGVTMASATVAGTIFLWSLADQTVLRRLEGHHEEVATLTFLDNGRLLASGSHDMTIGVWEVATGELRQRLRGHTRPVRKSAATATGQGLVTGGGDHFLYLWDWQRGAPQHLLTDHGAAIDHLVISTDGKRAATIDLNTVVSLWDLAQGQRIDFYPLYHNAIMSLQFTPTGETLVSGGSDGAVCLWQMAEDASAQMTARLIAHKQRVFAVAIHPDGKLIASAGDGSIIALWERSSGQLLHTLQSPARNIAMIAISPDGQWLASGDGDGTVSLWSLPAGRQRRQLQVHTNIVSCCAFSPSRLNAQGRPQQWLASGSFDHTLAIWDVESGGLLHHLQGHTNAVGRCLFSHDGQRLISISYDETLRIWDVASGQPLAIWPQSGGGYIALALHPAGEILAASCADHTLRLLDLKNGRCLAVLAGHSQIVVGLVFHPNGQWLASAGTDETIKLWDLSADALQSGQIPCLHTLQSIPPYAGMKITGVTGISEAQKAALKALGAVEE